MQERAHALFWLLLILIINHTYSSNEPRGPKFFAGRSREGFRRPPFKDQHLFASKAATLETLWFNQTLDHFNTSDTRIFKQRYFYNGKFYKTGGPAILMIGGEGPENGEWASLEKLPYMKWAQNLSAAIFDLEHRFYGRTRPFSQQTTENLKFLNSRQAIEDIAQFIKAMNVRHNFTNPKWIVYGGSYSGALALWFREKHPELTVGAVGSSAPMLATLDFHEYLEDIEEVLELLPNCKAALKGAMEEISSMIWTTEGKANLQTIFRTNTPFADPHMSSKDLQAFFSSTFGEFMEAIQYNGTLKITVNELCDIMTKSDNQSNAQHLAQAYFHMYNVNYTDNNYTAMIEFYQDPNYYDDGSNAASRSWYWQTCTEFGYYQSTDYGKGIFGSVVPLNLYIDICTDVFGKDYVVEAIQENVHSSNLFYGGKDNYKATNVVLLYGSIDPWHKLGMYENSDKSVIIYLINGTSHCRDMHGEDPSDPPGLAIARQIAYDNVKKWLTDTGPIYIDAKTEEAKTDVEPKQPALKFFIPTIREIKLTEVEKAKLKKKGKSAMNGKTPFMIMGRPYHGLVPDPPEIETDEVSPASELIERYTIEQPIDNFDNNNNDTYKQRFWVNMEYYRAGGPQFLFLEGESTAREKWLTTNVTFVRAAKIYGAMTFMLEHRFYGESRPYGNMSSASLKYLTTKQALADTARFIQSMNDRYNISNPRWVTFGGSYPGSLSAWFRQEYPHLTVGAIASSAGTNIKVDFFEYLINTEKSIRHFDNSCGDNVKTGFAKMNQLSLTPNGRAELSKTFKMKPEWTNDKIVSTTDVQFFFQDVYDKFQGAVQYNNDNTGNYMFGGGITDVCHIMNNASLGNEVQRIAEVYKYIVNFHGGNFTSLSNSYQQYVDFVRKDDYSDEEATNARGWMYSCCTEIGYLQTTDIGDNAFGSVCPVTFWLNFCEDVFGKSFVPARQIYKTVEVAQKYHKGSDGYTATNVVFVSGKIDPWHSMGLPKQRETETMKVFLLNETAHCADMYPPREQDSQELKAVREEIFKYLGEWTSLPVPTEATTTATATTTSAARTEIVSISLTILILLYLKVVI